MINLPQENPITAYIDKIALLIETGDPRLEIKISPLILQILSEIQLAASNYGNPVKNLEYHSYVKTACEFIENNYQKHIELKDMAKSAGLSPYHFSRVFKQYTGFSPYEYLIKFKINKAKNLLNNTNLTVERIAQETGFFDSGAFIRTFKKHEELTPLKYRNTSAAHI